MHFRIGSRQSGEGPGEVAPLPDLPGPPQGLTTQRLGALELPQVGRDLAHETEIERGGPGYTLSLTEGVRFREQRRGAGVIAPATGDSRQDR